MKEMEILKKTIEFKLEIVHVIKQVHQCLSHTKVAKFRKDMRDCSNGPIHVNCIEKVDTHIDEC